MSPDLQIRPRLSRYDRPALSLADLLKAEGTDFVCQAVWTMHGQRATRQRHDMLLEVLNKAGDKAAVLAALDSNLPAGAERPSLPGLRLLLMVERRRHSPLVGPLLAHATILADRHPAVGAPVRLARSLPGKVRWTYRHGRKLLIRLAGRSGLPSRTELRRTLGVSRAPATSDMSDRAASIYTRLCEAVDRTQGEA